MSDLRLLLLGSAHLERAGRELEVETRNALGLLVYLAVTKQTYTRDTLATLFWPEKSTAAARTHLRKSLWVLKKAVGANLLAISQQSVGINPEADLWLDVDHFRHLLASCEQHGHAKDEVCADCLSPLEEAVNLYRGDFLAGFALADSSQFDDWQFFQAESLRQELAGALERLVYGYSTVKDYESAILRARQWVALDPLFEFAQRTLMQVYHQAGQTSAALRQYDLFVTLLKKEMGLSPEKETTSLYEVIKADRKLGARVTKTENGDIKNDESIPAPAAQPHHNLPIQPTLFIGREKEVEEISRLLREEPNCRLLNLVGPGGMGKTRLALEVARVNSNLFRDGSFLVSLASVSEASFIVPAIAEAIKFPFQGETDPMTQLLRHLNQKNFLIILDNFEHLLSSLSESGEDESDTRISGEELLSEILRNAPGNKILVTSRERLKLQEEWDYEVYGMSFPQDLQTVEEAGQGPEKYTAIQLFLQQARKADASFAYSTEDMDAIVRICRLVEGMPLGIELAAPWIRLMSCREIADEIERNLDLLETSLRNVPERHRSMRAIFEQSWQRLSPEERTVLSKLSVFRGGCRREAAEAVTGAKLPLISSLVDKSLVHHAGGGRYELHELIRQFALDQLQCSSEIYAETLDRHCRYYTAFMKQQEREIKGGAQLEAVQRITADIDNVRNAWRRAVERRDLQAIEKAAESLFLYSEMRGDLVEAEAVFRRAATTLLDANNQNPDMAIREAQERLIGYLLVLQGVMATHLGSGGGLELTQKGAELVRGHSHGESPQALYRDAFCRMWLGWTSFLLGFYEAAEQHLGESLTVFSELNEQWAVSKTLYMISNSYIARGQLTKAEQALYKSLSICREIQDSRSRVLVNRTLGIVTLWFGDFPRTRQLLEEAVSLSEEFNDRFGLQSTLRELGKLEIAQGELERAAETLHKSIVISHDIGAEWEGELTYCDLGVLLRVQRNYAAAQYALQRALDAAIATQNRWWLPRCRAELGCLAMDQEDYALAKQLLLQALDLWKELNHEPFYAWGLAQLARVVAAHDVSQHEEARKLYKQALELAVKHDQAPIVLNIFTGLAAIMMQAGELQKALEILAPAARHPASSYETKEKARKLLAELHIDSASDASPVTEDHHTVEWQAIAADILAS